ncbi:MAG TPA: serine/threonine-protein kinase, partial [Pyrinomonadaceae bacterium]|nr:serine/threonine-protein kinase [Pyrinomonadaceae bacterium]
MLSESFSHYRIKKKLGAGGMGEVYLAEDLKLERPVALKILPEAFTRDEDRVRRFTGEARAVSRLNHPNIITIYEVGVEDESHYLATEYIEGETLRERINRGSLHLTEIIDIALQINGALGAAHALGIVHRDVKPENVMLRPDGIVKVLDFGLAKINEAPPSDAQQAATVVSRATEPGMILGTVNYMSPEQTRGLPLDPRTDLWSLGVVLYEMATGRLPFHGPTITDTIVSIVNEPPLLPHQLNPIIDESFSAILLKALAKDLSLRYQTAGEMSDELRILRSQLDSGAQAVSAARAEAGARPAQQTHFMSGAPTAPQDYATQIVQTPNTLRRLPLPYAVGALLFLTTLVGLSLYYFSIRRAATLNSVVVLPFVNESSDQQLEYLSDGLTESIINSLSQIPKLRVISRSTAFHYKGRDDFRNIGRDLNVGGILTGRVLK